MKCPFCGSNNSERLSVNYLSRKYEMQTYGIGVSGTNYGTFRYPIERRICFDCGNVFEKMSEENLEKYNDEKQYFV